MTLTCLHCEAEFTAPTPWQAKAAYDSHVCGRRSHSEEKAIKLREILFREGQSKV